MHETHAAHAGEATIPTGPPPSSASEQADARRAAYLYYRHRLPVRIMHWINVLALTILLMSGLNIFNAHPALHWHGKSSYTGAPPVLEMRAGEDADGDTVGVTTILGHEFRTTGLFGVSANADGELVERG